MAFPHALALLGVKQRGEDVTANTTARQQAEDEDRESRRPQWPVFCECIYICLIIQCCISVSWRRSSHHHHYLNSEPEENILSFLLTLSVQSRQQVQVCYMMRRESSKSLPKSKAVQVSCLPIAICGSMLQHRVHTKWNVLSHSIKVTVTNDLNPD